MDNLSGFDIVFIIFIFMMLVHGYIKGFVRSLFSWAALILASWAAILLYPAGGAYIRTMIMENVRVVPELFAFVAIFLIIMLVIKILERILGNIVAGVNLSGANRVLGAVFGIVEGLAFTALVIFVLTIQPLFDASGLMEGSFFVELLFPVIIILPGMAGVNV